MNEGLGDAAQMRQIAELIGEQIADAAIVKFSNQHPEIRKAEIPAPLKWAGAIIAGLFTAGAATLAGWLLFSVSEMQVTLGRMDERMQSQTTMQASDIREMDKRVTELESYHRAGAWGGPRK